MNKGRGKRAVKNTDNTSPNFNTLQRPRRNQKQVKYSVYLCIVYKQYLNTKTISNISPKSNTTKLNASSLSIQQSTSPLATRPSSPSPLKKKRKVQQSNVQKPVFDLEEIDQQPTVVIINKPSVDNKTTPLQDSVS